MTDRALELIPEYVLGLLGENDRVEVEALLKDSPEARAEAGAIAVAYSTLGRTLAPIAPPPALKTRLMAAITGAERNQPFANVLARYFDLAVDRVRELIQSIDDAATQWEAGPIPGLSLIHFSGGPKVATADCGFVRLTPGLHFPWHRHDGPEVNFVLEGTLKDWDGRVYGPGEALEKDGGSEHEFWADEEKGALIAVVVRGFEIVPPPTKP